MKIINIGILAHVDAGKTTVTEGLLYKSGAINKIGPMDATVHIDGHGEVSVRWILTHLIEEYSRHNGHVDLLRECLDGVVGE